MKLELGSGQRPTPGYIATDIYAWPGLDQVCNAWEVQVPFGSIEEILALGVIEHLTYQQARETFTRAHQLLIPGGEFWFDVPDIETWCSYFVDNRWGFSTEHILATLYGWQRWEGDEHKSGWTEDLLEQELRMFSEVSIRIDAAHFMERGHVRNRMTRPGDAHLYVKATK